MEEKAWRWSSREVVEEEVGVVEEESEEEEEEGEGQRRCGLGCPADAAASWPSCCVWVQDRQRTDLLDLQA